MIITENKKKIRNAKDIAEIMGTILIKEHKIDQNKEHCWTIGVNTNHVIQYIELVSLGSLNMSIVEPREVFRFAIMKGVASIFLVHNHPSGNLKASEEDTTITKKLFEAGKILNINLLDHLIIDNSDNYFSFHEEGIIL